MTERKLSLYKLAKYTNLEIVMEAQVQSTGANQARLIERYEKNKNSIKNQALALKIVYAVMLTMMGVIFPLFTYINILEQIASIAVSVETVVLVGGILFGLFFGMQLIYIMMFGLLSISSMMSGQVFRWYETLPISKDKLRKLGFMTLFRNMNVGLIAMTVVFPITIGIASQNWLLSLIGLVIAIPSTLFSFSILVIVAQRLSRILQVREIGSKKATTIRMLTMISYIVLMLTTSLIIQLAIMSIPAFFDFFSGIENPIIFSMILSVIPFPFAPGFLFTLLINPAIAPPELWPTTIIGVVLFIGLTYYVYRKAIKSMQSVTTTSGIEKDAGVIQRRYEDIEVNITSRTPVKAYIRKDLSTATRDIQTLMFLIMPIVLPLIIVIIMAAQFQNIQGDIEAIFIFWNIILIYQPMISIMITTGFLNMEDTGASILASLPIRSRDQAKAKLILLIVIQSISFVIPVIVLTFLIGSVEFFLFFVAFYPISLIFLFIMFHMKIRLFGRMKYRYVLEEINIQHKIWKWVLMVTVEVIVTAIFLVLGSIFFFLLGPMMTLISFLVISAVVLMGLIWGFTRMFPKVPGKKLMIGLRGSLRKYPIVGTLVMLPIYFLFLFLPGITQLMFIPLYPFLPFEAILIINFLFTTLFMTLLWLYLIPKAMHLPIGKEKVPDYLKSIHLRPKTKNVKKTILNVTLGILVSSALFLIVTIFGIILNPDYTINFEAVFGPPSANPPRLGWFIFIFMLTPGIWEEVSFRGVFMTMNLKRHAKEIALLVTSVFFGLFHFTNIISGASLLPTSVQVLYATMLGFTFGYMLIKTQSLIPCIIAHYLIDSVGQLFFTSISDPSLYIFYTIIGIGLIPMVLGFLITWLFTQLKVYKKDDIVLDSPMVIENLART